MLKPLAKDGWNYETAAHLLNRAGFGGPPEEIARLTDLGHDAALSSLLDYEKIPDPTPNPVVGGAGSGPRGTPCAPCRRWRRRTAARRSRRSSAPKTSIIIELRGWWLNRMAQGPRPFQEKMVLFWHGHFATSYEKVRNAYYMWRQNELFRRLATDYWLRLLIEAGKDPAMLVWLDQAQSRKEHPNENYAREVMELFSLGEGHYTEKDVTEGARALTGWSLDRDTERFIYRPGFHDNGDKTFLGLTGNLNGEDVMAQIVKQPQAAVFITGKLWNFFAGQMPSAELNTALADAFVQNARCFKPFLRVMFRSEEFYSSAVIRNQVKSPVQWLVGTSRMLQMRSAAGLRQRRHTAHARPGFVRAAERQGLGRRHHLDHDEHAAGAIQRRGHAGARARPSSFRRPISRASRAGRAAWSRRGPRNASTSAAWTWKKS